VSGKLIQYRITAGMWSS